MNYTLLRTLPIFLFVIYLEYLYFGSIIMEPLTFLICLYLRELYLFIWFSHLWVSVFLRLIPV